ncbi:MAG: DUF5908 family protein [Cytophagales bacterium]|nr:DUF5908 family protein [Cytophagales bacterium]
MSVEVRELIIRTSVNAAEEKTTAASGKQQATRKGIYDGLDSLLELIKNKNER